MEGPIPTEAEQDDREAVGRGDESDVPILSIITVTYNRAHALKANLESVAEQTFADIEHIIVDNMSDDGTAELVSDYQREARCPVTYIREPDTGIYHAMNKGLRLARGIWSHVLNSDDVYAEATVLQELFSRELDGYDLIANTILMVGDSEPNSKQLIWIPAYDNRLNHYNFPHSGIVIRNSFYRTHGYYREDFRIVSDAVYGIEHYPKAKYMIVERPLVIMRRGGASENTSFRNLHEKMICLICYHRLPMRTKVLWAAKELHHFLRRVVRTTVNGIGSVVARKR